MYCSVLQCVAVCCSVLQCVLQCVAVCCSVLQRIAVCCSMLQCVAAVAVVAAKHTFTTTLCKIKALSVDFLRVTLCCNVMQRDAT